MEPVVDQAGVALSRGDRDLLTVTEGGGRRAGADDGRDAEVAEAVRSVLSRGMRAGMRLSAAGGDVTMQTIGHRDQLRGVLVVGSTDPLDAAGTDLVASVIALASITVEQTRTLEEARDHLRSGLLELVLAGSLEVARSTAQRVGDALPKAPLRVAVFRHGPNAESLRQGLERKDRSRSHPWFVANRSEATVVVVAEAATNDLLELLTRHRVRAGLSGPGNWAEISALLNEAEQAHERTDSATLVARFETMYGDGFMGLVDHHGGAEVARRLLGPLHQHPDGAVLGTTLRAWFDAGCAWDPASRSLGVHRHTLRNRVRVVEELLDVDLETFSGRAELWLALQFDSV